MAELRQPGDSDPRSSVLRALRFEQASPVPYTVWYVEEVGRRLAEHYGTADWAARIRDAIKRYTIEWEPREYLEPGVYRDLHGTTWREGNPPHIVSPALPEPSLAGYGIPAYAPHVLAPQARDDHAWGGIMPYLSLEQTRQSLVELDGAAFSAVGYGSGGILERAWMIRGFESFYTDLVLEPSFVHGLLDAILERQLELVDLLAGLPCDAIFFADDWGDQRGVNIGPQRWREFIKPRIRLLYERAHSLGKRVFHHSCGNVADIVPDLIEIGLDCLQSLQPEAMPVYELKRRYGRHLALWGGLGTQRLLPFGTPEEIRREALRLKRELGRGGGYIFSTSKPIMAEVPTENAVALIEASIAAE